MPVLFQQPPPAPNPGSEYSADDMATLVRAVNEAQSFIETLAEFLAPYDRSATAVPDSQGALQYYVLASNGGSAPPQTTANTNPYAGSDDSDGSTPAVDIQYGTHNNFPPSIGGTPMTADGPNTLTLDGSAQIVYVQVDFTYDTSGTVTVTDASISFSSSSTPPANVITPAGDGSGSGTLYQTLFAVTVTFDGDGNATVIVGQNVGGSQGFNVCQGPGASTGADTTDSISGPWGV